MSKKLKYRIPLLSMKIFVSLLVGLSFLSRPVFSESGPLRYLIYPQANTVVVLNTDTNQIVGQFKVGNGPIDVAVSPAGSPIFVLNLGALTISVIDVPKKAILQTIHVGGNPANLVVHPKEHKLYFFNTISSPGGTYVRGVSVIDTRTFKIIKSILVADPKSAGWPTELVIAPDGSKLYVGDMLKNAYHVVDLRTDQVTQKINLPEVPSLLALSPDGKRLYALIYLENFLAVIDTSSNTIVQKIQVGGMAEQIQQNADGSRLYVLNRKDSTVSVIDAQKGANIQTIQLDQFPVEIFLNPSGTRLFVTYSMNDNIDVIDLVTNKKIQTLHAGVNITVRP